MKALAGKRNWFQKLGDGIKNFAHGVASAMIPGAIPAQINAKANLAIQQRREELQVEEMKLAVLRHEDNKRFQENVAQVNYQRNRSLQQFNQAANEKLAQENYQRNLEIQWNNQAFQEKMAQLSHENQQKLERHRAMVQLAIQEENINFQKWRLEKEKALQLQIIGIRQEFEREIARYNRETALNNIREQRRQANSPIALVSDDLLESPYRDGTMPLQILLSPPELNYDSFGQKSFGFKIENHLAEELRQFLDIYYPFNGEDRQTQLLDGAWVSKKFRGGGGIKSLFSQLKTIPIVVLESEVDSDYLNFRVAYWRGDGNEYQYRSILSNFPYRDFLYESARERARKWQAMKQLLLTKGRTPENVKAIGGDSDFNLFILQEEQQLLNEGFDLDDSDIKKQYRVNEKDFQKLHQFLITCHCLTVSVIADIHYLSSGKNLTPLLPSLLQELLEDVPDSSELQTTMLDWLLTIYNQMYEKLEEVLHSWIPELILQFAVVLTSLEDKSYAIQQGKQSVKAWLQLRGMETIERKSLHSIVTKDDEPYFKYLQEFLAKVEDINDLSEAKILLEAWLILQDLGIVKDKSTVSTDDFFQASNNNAVDIFNEAVEFSENKQYDKALACYDKCLELKPDNSSAWYNRGGALWALNRHEEAITSYNKALKIDPNMYMAWIQKAWSLTSLNRKEEAIASYDKAFKIKNNDAMPWILRGQLLLSLERYEEALESYNTASKLELDSSNWDINGNWKADIWYKQGLIFGMIKKYDEEIAAYDQAISLQPNYALFWYLRGEAYRNYSLVGENRIDVNRLQSAIDSYTQAVVLDAENADAFFQRGLCCQVINQKERAVESYKKAAKIYYAKGEVDDYSKALENLDKLLKQKAV